MPINMSRYVRIISSVSGAAAVAQQQLFGRRFTTDPRVPIGQIVAVTPGGAEDYFGANSPEADFARQYFSYISPAPASQARELQFAAYSPNARGARVYGFPITASLADFQGITNGSITFVVDGVPEQVANLDLSGVVSFNDVANEIMSNLPGSITGEIQITYDAISSTFEFVRNTAAAGTLEVEDGNLAQMLGAVGARTVVSPGSDGQTLLEAFVAAEAVTDSFGSASFGAETPLAEALDVAEYVSAQNVKYQMYWSVNSVNADTWSAAMIGTASQGLILNETPGEYKEAIPMAIMAATDYSRTNAAINYMFRQSGVTLVPEVTTDQMADYYDARRVNYYGQTANAGQRISFFQRGVLTGGATAPLDMGVHANEQDLKAYLKAQLMSLLLTTNKIPANLDGRGMVLAIVQGGVDRGLNNGTILPGKTLTELQKVAIIQGTGDPLAWHDVQTNGYWYDAEIVQQTDESGTEEYVANYTLFYAKGDSVRRIEGSHNLI